MGDSVSRVSYATKPTNFGKKRAAKAALDSFYNFRSVGLLLFIKHVVLLLKNADERGAFG